MSYMTSHMIMHDHEKDEKKIHISAGKDVGILTKEHYDVNVLKRQHYISMGSGTGRVKFTIYKASIYQFESLINQLEHN